MRGGDESHLRDAQARDADAARVEALALHRVYRLVARAGEALALLDVLLRARDAEDRTNWAAAKDAPPPQPPKISLASCGDRLNHPKETRTKAVHGRRRASETAGRLDVAGARLLAEGPRVGKRVPASALVAPSSSDKVKPYAWPHDLARELGASCGLFFRGAMLWRMRLL